MPCSIPQPDIIPIPGLPTSLYVRVLPFLSLQAPFIALQSDKFTRQKLTFLSVPIKGHVSGLGLGPVRRNEFKVQSSKWICPCAGWYCMYPAGLSV